MRIGKHEWEHDFISEPVLSSLTPDTHLAAGDKPDISSHQIFIYGLLGPDSDKVRYVGMTDNPVKTLDALIGMSHHRAGPLKTWLAKLGKDRQQVEMLILDVFPDNVGRNPVWELDEWKQKLAPDLGRPPKQIKPPSKRYMRWLEKYSNVKD